MIISKRGVNNKVLKVPGVEHKVLDATSSEPWGPHGHEYQTVMAVLWKRINDTGKNWRHVYKALTVLEYLVGHGSERVIDEIKEHAYQISCRSVEALVATRGDINPWNRQKLMSCAVWVLILHLPVNFQFPLLSFNMMQIHSQ
ncbi:hypothetical protein C5167_035769 [Papaver somniferum]|nr:hypothetical protein C5167_035769 [Papaver somniferum]